MPKIHGLVYIVIGLFASVMSWILNFKKLIFFFFIGLIFVLVGIIKIVISLRKNKIPKNKTSHKTSEQDLYNIRQYPSKQFKR